MKWLNDWLGFFKPLQVRNLQIFWSGQASALIGMWLQVTAMGILVYDISGGSATAVGVLAALNALPFFLGGMLLAGLGDRFDRRKLLIAVQCVQWLVAVALFLLTVLDMLQLWHLYAAGLVMGVNQTVGFPTQQAFVGDLIPRRQLQEAVGMYSLVFNTCRAIGPALAGYIIAEWGAGTAFGGNVAASLPLVGCLVALKGCVADTSAPRKQRGAGRKASGLKTVLATRSLLFIMISALIQNICGQSLYQIVPALMHGNPRNTGLILSAVGAGAMVSILFVLPFARKSDRVGAKLSSGTLWMGCALCVAGVVPVVEVQALCFFFAGLAHFFPLRYFFIRCAASGSPGTQVGHSGAVQHCHHRCAAAGGHGVGSCGGCLGCSDNDCPGGRVGSLVFHLDAERSILASFQIFSG